MIFHCNCNRVSLKKTYAYPGSYRCLSFNINLAVKIFCLSFPISAGIVFCMVLNSIEFRYVFQVAESNDRIHLTTTQYNYARYLETQAASTVDDSGADINEDGADHLHSPNVQRAIQLLVCTSTLMSPGCLYAKLWSRIKFPLVLNRAISKGFAIGYLTFFSPK